MVIRAETPKQLLAAIQSGAEIELVGGREYLVDPRNAYQTAIRLDGIEGLEIRTDRTAEHPATIKLAPGDYAKSEPVVLFGMGRTARASRMRFERIALDGNDSQIVGESKQQSALVRAFCCNDLAFDRVAFNNIAADGIKIAGHPDRGRAFGISLRDCTSDNTGRAAVVVQSLTEDIEIIGFTALVQRKAAIDIEATMDGHRGPRGVRLIECDLTAVDGLQIGGNERVEAYLDSVSVHGPVLVHNGRVTMISVFAESLLVRKRSQANVISSRFDSVELTHHQSQCPSALLRSSSLGALRAKSHSGLELVDCGCESVTIDNEARDVDLPSVRIRNTRNRDGQPTPVKIERRPWSSIGDTIRE